MFRLGPVLVVCLGLLGPAPALAQPAGQTAAPRETSRPAAAAGAHADLIVPPGFGGGAPTSGRHARTRARAHRDLLVPAGFGVPARTSESTSELIVPEIFRADEAPDGESLAHPEWESGRVSSELRVPAIFQRGTEESTFRPAQIEDGLLVPEAFRRSPRPPRGRLYRVREELRAPGFEHRSRPSARSASRPASVGRVAERDVEGGRIAVRRPAAARPASAPTAAGLGRRLDSPARR